MPPGANPHIPKLTLAAPPAGDSGAVAEAAKMLTAAENPVIVAGRAARTAEGLRLMVELAETLQCAVIDTYQRLNFPSHHPLNLSMNPRAALGNADLVLALEPGDLYGTLRPVRAQRALKLITITAGDLYIRSNYQDFQRFTESDLAIAVNFGGRLGGGNQAAFCREDRRSSLRAMLRAAGIYAGGRPAPCPGREAFHLRLR